jgi:hypothetical protein
MREKSKMEKVEMRNEECQSMSRQGVPPSVTAGVTEFSLGSGIFGRLGRVVSIAALVGMVSSCSSLVKTEGRGVASIETQEAEVGSLDQVTSLDDRDCGKDGTIEQRIRNCSGTLDRGFQLAARLNGVSYYWDQVEKMLWSDQIKEGQEYSQAKSHCEKMPAMDGLSWGLPTEQDFGTLGLDEDGIQKKDKASQQKLERFRGFIEQPNIVHFFWTQTPIPQRTGQVSVFIPGPVGAKLSRDSRFSPYYIQESLFSVVCVAK